MSLLGGVGNAIFGGPPPTPDFNAAADKQMWASRPDQNNPFGSMSWQQGPDGKWTQNMQFNPEMQGLYSSLIGGLRRSLGKGIGTGDDARKQAFDASWANAQQNLMPQLQQNYDRGYSNMVNQGIDVGNKAAFGTGIGDLQQSLNAGTTGAWNAAMQQGLNAQNLTYQQNRDAYMAPFSALGQMKDLATPFGFQTGGNYQTAAEQQFNADMESAKFTQGNITNLGNLASGVMSMPGVGNLFNFGGGAPGAPGSGGAGNGFSLGNMDYGTGAGNGYFGGGGQPMWKP